MNKTVTINISGIIFHIEEDAYEKLSRYLGTIKGYFSQSDGRDEIMADIEARIAEMLQERVNQTKQVVLMADVDHVITVMGQPEEFRTEAAGGTDANAKEHEPAAETFDRSGRRRMFRDPDDRVFGGVCSGLGAYFGIDPVWLRIAFAIAFFAYGSGLLLYILLWVIIPVARTTAEKLEMRGERVNVNNISRTVEEEMEHVRKRMENLGKQVNTKENRERVRDGIDSFVHVIASIFKYLGKAIAIFFIVLGTIILIGLIGSLLGLNNAIHFTQNGEHISFTLRELADVLFTSSSQTDIALTGFILLAGIPLVSLIYLGIRLLFNIRSSNRLAKFSLFALWIMGWILVAIAAVQLSREFDETTTSRQVGDLDQPKSDTLYLRVRTDKRYDFTSEKAYDSRVMIKDWNIVEMNDRSMIFGWPRLDIVESETDSFELVIIKSASGTEKKEAQMRARNISYSFYQSDSLLEFAPYFDISSEDKFRAQSVRMVLKVPKGKVIYLSRNMDRLIYDIQNVQDAWNGDMVNRRWIMTSEGLSCIDCEGLEERPHRRSRHSQLPEPPPPPPHIEEKNHGH
jgi:phage shock protein PspC (stress-responsive transcriptional regulator)